MCVSHLCVCVSYRYASCAKRLAVELNRLGSQLQAMQLASAFNVTLT